MAKIKLLVDTDIFIEYFNHGNYAGLLDATEFQVHYSVVSRKELLSKKGLKDSEQKAIKFVLSRYRQIHLDTRITAHYCDIRRRHPHIEKADALIAASALSRHLPLVTRNRKHFQAIRDLTLFSPP